jgi:hypothetical protein
LSFFLLARTELKGTATSFFAHAEKAANNNDLAVTRRSFVDQNASPRISPPNCREQIVLLIVVLVLLFRGRPASRIAALSRMSPR